jgi:adenylosuccinate synthase
LRAVDLFSSKKTEEFVNQLSITQLEKTNILNQLNRAIERGFLNYIHDTSLYLNEAIKNGSQVLAEGAQGTLLDIDHGTYPYVTSSNTVAGAACTGLGIGPTKITSVIGVVKAYSTRVGNGPFVSQMSLDTEEHIRLKGKEYGATTGRARRCGWLDMVALKHSCRVNGITHLALTKIDVLDGLDKVKVCTGYKYNDEIFSEVPTSLEVLEKCEPIFTTFDGWPDRSRLSGKNQTLASLDPNERKYLQFIWQSLGVEPMIISTGPERDQTILI